MDENWHSPQFFFEIMTLAIALVINVSLIFCKLEIFVKILSSVELLEILHLNLFYNENWFMFYI